MNEVREEALWGSWTECLEGKEGKCKDPEARLWHIYSREASMAERRQWEGEK